MRGRSIACPGDRAHYLGRFAERSSRFSSRDHRPYDRPMIGGCDFELSAELAHTLIHAAQADAERAHPVFTRLLQQWRGDSFSAVANFQDRISIIQGKEDVRLRTAG